MHMGRRVKPNASPGVILTLLTTRSRAFLFPIGIKMILMNHKKRTPMKLLKTMSNKALRIILSIISVVLILTLVGSAVAVAFYALLLVTALAGVAYIILRPPYDPLSAQSTKRD
jgi:hypothetical protein